MPLLNLDHHRGDPAANIHSLVIDPLPHLQPQVAGYKGHRLGIVHVVDVGTVGAGNLQDIAEALGKDVG